ncbi:Uncharacterised protein [BD1-7 clade bacterium]|uniref:Uncharacterized protein n=1 Tax=BD1-7 clade bacterium TaxID=2029982 RepID=A0A5S9QUL7_9GAMM|nr:Uncharacterised protein [BD1-7 clade bacterium]CAA0122549.1 Uncharacterised protein [BD1-7 clade bacterium]
MQMTEEKALIRVSRLLMVSMTLLVMAEVAFLLQGVFSYIAGVIGACVVLVARFLIYRYKDEKGWKQKLMMMLPLIAIVGPFFYLLFEIFYQGSTSLWLELILVCSFVLPVVTMYWCYRIVQGLIVRAHSANY